MYQNFLSMFHFSLQFIATAENQSFRRIKKSILNCPDYARPPRKTQVQNTKAHLLQQPAENGHP